MWILGGYESLISGAEGGDWLILIEPLTICQPLCISCNNSTSINSKQFLLMLVLYPFDMSIYVKLQNNSRWHPEHVRNS